MARVRVEKVKLQASQQLLEMCLSLCRLYGCDCLRFVGQMQVFLFQLRSPERHRSPGVGMMVLMIRIAIRVRSRSVLEGQTLDHQAEDIFCPSLDLVRISCLVRDRTER